MLLHEKIKIAFAIESLDFGGREKVLLEVANGLDASKYEVHVIAFSNDRNRQSALLNNNIFLHSLPFKNRQLITPLNVFLSPLIILKFLILLKKINPSIVHTHFLYQLLFLAAISIKLSRIRTCHFHTIHTAGLYYTEKGAKNTLTLRSENYSIKLNHAYLITVSRQLEQIALSFFNKSASGIKCIINGVNEIKFDFHLRCKIKKTDWGFSDEDIIVSYIARFDAAQKDHLTLLKAWKIVIQNVPAAKLCLAGNGDARADAEHFVKNNKLHDSVIFLGNISNVNELLAVTDVGVFTSRYEGLSVALLEKMFMKLPLVVTNIPAFSSIVDDGKSGYLFNAGDYKTLAERLINFITDNELRYTMGNYAFNTVKSYTIKSMVKQHDDYYQEVLSSENFR